MLIGTNISASLESTRKPIAEMTAVETVQRGAELIEVLKGEFTPEDAVVCLGADHVAGGKWVCATNLDMPTLKRVLTDFLALLPK